MQFGLTGTADDWLGESPPNLSTHTSLSAYAFLASFDPIGDAEMNREQVFPGL